METKREKQVRVLTALHDIMPALRDYAAVAAAHDRIEAQGDIGALVLRRRKREPMRAPTRATMPAPTRATQAAD